MDILHTQICYGQSYHIYNGYFYMHVVELIKYVLIIKLGFNDVKIWL